MWVFFLLAACTSGDEPCPEGEVRAQGECVRYTAGDPVQALVWSPAPGTPWQWQLTGAVDTSLDVDMYDVDLFNVTDAELTALSDRLVVCYFSAGSWEGWRADAEDFPEESLGRALDGWSDERWLDHTDPGVRAVMEDRLDLAVARGCDGVEPDNMDGYDNRSGFPMNATEQLDYNRFIADEAHRRGLSVGLKNDLGQLEALEPWFDWGLNEECAAYDECDRLAVFTGSGKAVFHTEYVDDWSDAPALAEEMCGVGPDLDTLIKTWDLGPEYLACE
ncbi:MAG: endo alpha-1,4 polygalactosaminidase [Deltaproteobacteria bacterium]|nr:endo alpha-1,4 polygalactosaminidase [Deltaproteobacteria bacterium]